MRHVLRLLTGHNHAAMWLFALVLSVAQTASAQDSTLQLSSAKRIWPLAALRAGTPGLVSLGMGAMYSMAGDFVGPFISIEPGMRAGRASVGYSMLTGNLAAGPMVRASFLRRYHGSVQRNYAGLEVQYAIALLGPRLGVFRSTNGGESYLLALDFGIGF